MGILSFLFGNSSANDRYVSEASFKKNLANQVNMSSQTIEQLRKYDVSDKDKLKLEFFFYTNSKEKSISIAEKLAEKGYSVEYGKSAGDNDSFIITGWTNKIIISEKIVKNWVKEMCEIGYRNDCEFDGWGTNPEQD